MSAKEMFEELGYEILIEKEECFIYKGFSYPEYDDSTEEIKFDKICKTITKIQNLNSPCEITINELKAINKQIEELGWK